MIPPDFLDKLNEAYKRELVKHSKLDERQQSPEAKQEFHGRPIDTLQHIVNARSLWASIKPQLEGSDFFMLMVNGQQGSGKTTVAREIAHYAHTDKTAPYKILYTSGYDVETAPARFKAEAEGAERVCIVFDDLSYILSTLTGKRQADIKSYFAVIRHDIHAKILCIINSHFQTAIPPIFRNSNQWVFSKPSMIEFDTMLKVSGRSAKQKAALDSMFQNIVAIQEQGSEKGVVKFKYDKRLYQFKWNEEGRLMMLISNGNPFIYRSQSVTCPGCEIIGKKVAVDTTKFEKREADVAEEKREEKRQKGNIEDELL